MQKPVTPSPYRKILSRILIGLVCLGAVGQFARFLMSAEVEVIEVEGLNRASEVSIRHLADLREGDRLLGLDLERVVNSVKRHPWVSEVQIRRKFPSTVRIQVEEHTPVLLLAHRGLFFVSDSGEIFVRARTLGVDLPVLTGVPSTLIDDQPVVAQRIIDEALNVLTSVQASSALDPNRVSEIRFDEKLGFSLHLRNHSRIHLGFRQPLKQMTRLEQMLRQGLDLSARLEVDLDIDGMAVASPLAG